MLRLQSLGDAMTDIVLTHGTVVTMNERREIVRDGAIAIDDNRISAVGKTTDVKASHRADIELDCRGKLVIPGLIDCHVHLAQALIRGCADDLSLVPWLRERVHPMQGAYSPNDGELTTKLCWLESSKSGTTCFVESRLH
ncbi:MAG: amidohydrolase, partial [Hadesarchaea archaeon]